MSDCSDCSAPGRRQFLREVTGAVAGIMAALSASPREAHALPLSLDTALATAGDERTYSIPPADGAIVDRDNEVILVRWKGLVFGFALSCPHQHTAVKWLAADTRFQCPKHKSKYQPDGTFMSGRATRNMDRYAIRKQGKSVIVNLARLYRNDKQAASWASAKVAV